MKKLNDFCEFMEEYLDEVYDPLERQRAVIATSNQKSSWGAPGYDMFDVSRKNKETNRKINSTWGRPKPEPKVKPSLNTVLAKWASLGDKK